MPKLEKWVLCDLTEANRKAKVDICISLHSLNTPLYMQTGEKVNIQQLYKVTKKWLNGEVRRKGYSEKMNHKPMKVFRGIAFVCTILNCYLSMLQLHLLLSVKTFKHQIEGKETQSERVAISAAKFNT